MSTSFARLATVTASTKRGSMTAGKQTAPTTYLTTVKCTPLDPVSVEDIRRLNINTPAQLLETFTESTADIKIGDRLVVGAVEYPVRAAENWAFLRGTYLHLVLDNNKAAE